MAKSESDPLGRDVYGLRAYLGMMKNTLQILAFSFLLAFAQVTVAGKADSTVGDKIKAGALVVDVRTPEEYSEGMYPGAKNIPLDQVEARIAEFGPKNKPVVLYCKSGRRSGIAAEILKNGGYTDVTNAGGLKDMPQPAAR